MSEFDDQLNALLSNPESMAQIMQLARSLSGDGNGSAPADSTQQQVSQPPSPPSGNSQRPSSPSAGGDLLSALGGGVDPKLMMRLLPLIQELGGQQDSNARQLLYALRPYLKPERQEKVERALQLARLFHLGKRFLAGWEG